MPASQGHGVDSQRRSRRDESRWKNTPGTRRTAVYFDSMAAPSAAPAAIQRRPSRPSIASQARDIVSAQKNISGESGNPASETSSPTGITVNRRTDQTAAPSP